MHIAPILPVLLVIGLASPAAVAAKPKPAKAAKPLASALTLQEWRKAENRNYCAPVGFISDGGIRAEARRANFAGGWAVAFDAPGKRSAYGIAGVGQLNDDRLGNAEDRKPPVAMWRRDLQRQWPYFRELSQPNPPSFAGYGVEGAGAYPASNPKGKGMDSLAYVRIGGQTCLYNVWSKVSRQHLETLLANLRFVPR